MTSTAPTCTCAPPAASWRAWAISTRQSFPELRKKASRLTWEAFLSPGQPVALRVTCHKSKLYHSGAVAERVAGAIGDRLAQTD